MMVLKDFPGNKNWASNPETKERFGRNIKLRYCRQIIKDLHFFLNLKKERRTATNMITFGGKEARFIMDNFPFTEFVKGKHTNEISISHENAQSLHDALILWEKANV